MTKLRSKGIITNIIIILTLLFSLWGTGWSIIEWGIDNLGYFTTQSNLLVFITLFIFYIGKDNKKYFSYLSAITLINIIMTGVIFHLLLATPPIGFQLHLTHTITPILYTMFYYIVAEKTIKTKQFWIFLIHPLLYFTFFLITGPFTGFYPYGFMNVAENGLLSVLKFTGLFLLPAIAILSFGLIFLKNRLEDAIKG